MTEYQVVLIDDEALALDVLVHYLKSYPEFKVIGKFNDPVLALSFIKSHKVDLVLTDIAMPEVSGIDIVKLLKDQTQFIMTTSFSEFAVQSFELNVVDYLMKPISSARFAKSIEIFKASNKLIKANLDTFFIKDGDDFVKVIIQDIDYIEGMKDYVKIVCGHRFHMALKTLKSMEIFLAPWAFMRVHKSYIVPCQKITQSNHRSLIIGDHEIPVGPKYRERLRTFLKERLI